MRLYEFTEDTSNTPESNLVTALELIQHRYKDKGAYPKIPTQSLIQMVTNTDRTFNYDALVNANETNPAVKNLIKTFNKDTIELHPADGDDTTTTNPPDDVPTTSMVDTVGSMANRAAKVRGAPIY